MDKPTIRHFKYVCLQHRTPKYSCITNPDLPKVLCAPPSLHDRNRVWSLPWACAGYVPPSRGDRCRCSVCSKAHPWHSLRSVCVLGPTWGVPGAVPWLGVLVPHGAWQGDCPAAPCDAAGGTRGTARHTLDHSCSPAVPLLLLQIILSLRSKSFFILPLTSSS